MISNRAGRERLIFALDMVEDMEGAEEWIEALKDHVGMFKVGKELFTRLGPSIVSRIKDSGGDVFLDLKFHDIPNTVAKASEAAVKLGVSMFNIHALGGIKMMEEAARSVREISEKMKLPVPSIIAVTVLTSLDDADIREIGFDYSTAELVPKLAGFARDAGLSGVVASAHDVPSIREACGEDFIIVTPGIRVDEGIAGDDQKRILTPKRAISLGADYIVVGRPIRMADDPVAMADRISGDIEEGLGERERH
jgi:orotidine-5'-phosphate decarboxylase